MTPSAVMMIDGIDLGEHTDVVAFGITTEGSSEDHRLPRPSPPSSS
jgi:hypothetical protein